MYKLQIHTNNNAHTYGKCKTLCFGKVVPIICGLQLSSLFKPCLLSWLFCSYWVLENFPKINILQRTRHFVYSLITAYIIKFLNDKNSLCHKCTQTSAHRQATTYHPTEQRAKKFHFINCFLQIQNVITYFPGTFDIFTLWLGIWSYPEVNCLAGHRLHKKIWLER